MAAQNKIEKYQLGDKVLALAGTGATAQAIAEILTEDLEGDSISQPTVSRYLQKVRGERAVAAQTVMDNFVEVELPADLQILSDIKTDYLSFRNDIKDRMTGTITATIMPQGMETVPATLKNLMTIDNALHELVKTTLRFVGVGDNDMPGLAEAIKLAEQNMGVIPSLDKEKAA